MVPFWSYYGSMSVSLSIKNVPDNLAGALRDQAKANHRSIQGELMAILEAAVKPRVSAETGSAPTPAAGGTPAPDAVTSRK